MLKKYVRPTTAIGRFMIVFFAITVFLSSGTLIVQQLDAETTQADIGTTLNPDAEVVTTSPWSCTPQGMSDICKMTHKKKGSTKDCTTRCQSVRQSARCRYCRS